MPILFKGDPDPSSVSAPAILVATHLPDDGRAGSVPRLGSGSNVPLLYVDRQVKVGSRAETGTVRGNTIGKQAQFSYATTPGRNVRLGTRKEIPIALATPVGVSRLCSKPGEDGVLPTTLFKRVFISTASHFVMFDPR